MLAQIGKIEETVNAAKKVILRYNIPKVKRIEKLVLRLIVVAHHQKQLRQSTRNHYLIDVLSAGVFQQNRLKAATHAPLT